MNNKDDTPHLSCFAIGPIGDKHAEATSEYRKIYEDAIQVWEEVIVPACKACDIEPVRADFISRTGEIPEQICRHLRDDDIVIADLTGGNANVMYELGLRHTTGKLTMQLGERGRLPFDVAAIRTIMFKRSEGGLIEARKQLERALSTGLSDGADPITATRIWLELQTDAVISAQESDSFSENEPDDEELGFLEKLADTEIGLKELSIVVLDLTEPLAKINQLMANGTEQVNNSDARGGGLSARLAIANNLAQKLREPSLEFKASIDDYGDRVDKISPGIFYLLDRLEKEPELSGEIQTFVKQMFTFADNITDSIEKTKGFKESMSRVGEASRSLRKVANRIIESTNRFIALSSPAIEWRERLQNISISS